MTAAQQTCPGHHKQEAVPNEITGLSAICTDAQPISRSQARVYNSALLTRRSRGKFSWVVFLSVLCSIQITFLTWHIMSLNQESYNLLRQVSISIIGSSGSIGNVHRPFQQGTDICKERLKPNNRSYVALCAKAKNEQPSIREWVLHHHRIGVNKFYLFDDDSQPPMQGAIQDFIDVGLVEYTFLFKPLQPSEGLKVKVPSVAIHEHCLDKAKGRHMFLGFIDIDEFIVLKNSSETINTLLHDFESYGGLAVNWLLFGSSGHLNRPPKGVLRSSSACVPREHELHLHVKSIGRVDRISAPVGSHHNDYAEGYYAVTTNYERVPEEFSQHIVHDRVVLHHYILRSIEDFQTKSKRGLLDGKPGRDVDFFNYIDSIANETCSEGVLLGEELVAAYGNSI